LGWEKGDRQGKNRTRQIPRHGRKHQAGARRHQDLNNLLTGQVVINEARYYAENQSQDVTEAIKQRVESATNQHFKIGNDLAGKDLLPGEMDEIFLNQLKN